MQDIHSLCTGMFLANCSKEPCALSGRIPKSIISELASQAVGFEELLSLEPSVHPSVSVDIESSSSSEIESLSF